MERDLNSIEKDYFARDDFLVGCGMLLFCIVGSIVVAVLWIPMSICLFFERIINKVINFFRRVR